MKRDMATVLVIGATRGVGLLTVQEVLAAGHYVRAMARSIDKLKLDHPQLEAFAGDALNKSDLRQALAGVDAVILTLGVATKPSTVLHGTKLFSSATRALIDVMQETGVERLICLTGFGTGDSRNQGGVLWNAAFNLILARIYDDKNIQEHLIRHSTLAWTIARPGVLTDSPLTNRYRVLLDPKDWRGGFISRADVADFLARQVDTDSFVHKAPVLIS